MKFEVLERDGLARIGRLEIDGVSFETPAVAYVDSECCPAPSKVLRVRADDRASKGDIKIARSAFVRTAEPREADAVLSPGCRGSPYGEEETSDGMAVLPNTAAMLLDSALFANQVAALKSGAGLLKPLYCSVMGLPHRLALLVYCGFDVFDSIPLVMAARSGTYLTSSGALAYDRIRDLPCSCPACASGRRGLPELLQHNYAAAEDELKLVRHAISEGRLRELVEGRIRSDPWLVQDLRLMDIEHYDLQEMHAPIKGAPFHAGSKESLQRPDVVRWRRRLERRYKRPESAAVLLLLPCSAKKPYSISQSHMRFRQVLRETGRLDAIHEVIVTSPLGLVPRELEMFYPAKDYDIPVTGHWDRDERRLVEEMVAWLVESQRYDLVISHLGDERETVNSVLRDFVDTSKGSPGARESLAKLEEVVSAQVPEPRSVGRQRLAEDLRSVCRFQFGEAGDRLCDGAQVWGRWPNVKILRGEAQLGMLTGERGMVSLTLEGAETIAATGAYCVEIDDFEPRGNLFAVGVESCTPEVRTGDDVAVAHGGEVRAVGVARMCAAEMVIAERGEAVHIRHAR